MFHSENNSFPISDQVLLSQQKEDSRSNATESFVSTPMPISYSFPVAKSSYGAHSSNSWKDASSQNATIWNVNSVDSSDCDLNAMYANYTLLSMPMIVDGLNAEPSRQLYFRNTAYPNVYTDIDSSSGSGFHCQDRHKPYQEASVDYSAVHSSMMGAHPSGNLHTQAAHLSVEDVEGHVLCSSLGNPIASSKLHNLPGWDHYMARKAEAAGYANEQLSANLNLDTNGRSGLSLSLSSIPSAELRASQFDARYGCQEVQHMDVDSHHCTEELKRNLDTLCHRQFANDLEPTGRPFGLSGKEYSNTVGCNVSASSGGPTVSGPLGPFTGYSTILNRSKFSSPAQQLLDEFVSGGRCEFRHHGNEPNKKHHVGSFSTRADLQVEYVSYDAVDSGVDMQGSLCSSSVVGTSSSLPIEDGTSDVIPQGLHIDYQQRRMTLVAMLDEVIRRYDYYNQQIKMVLSSFQLVSGLSTATPCISYAMKMISKHFRCVKHIINGQLQDISKSLGDDPNTSFDSKGDVQKFKFIDQSLRQQRAYPDDRHQPVWRPQRGLPERAVSVLRAWLFEHFLHPYPTDSDKHMLADQTGLSRNQVSNWFINARVRIWKPMVEEIHMLETQKSSGTNFNAPNDVINQNCNNRNPSVTIRQSTSTEGLQIQEGCSYSRQNTRPGINDMPVIGGGNIQLNDLVMKQKSSFPEIGTNSDFYQRDVNVGGLGAVSLTLGLMHNEGMQRDYAINIGNDDMLQ